MHPTGFALVMLVALLNCTSAIAQGLTDDVNYTRIAFGSCNRQFNEQPLWKDIINYKPDLWVWLGDNIYADTDDMVKMAGFYEHQLQHPGYRQLLETTPVTGIWDDHDYGRNEADKHYKQKKQSQQLFLDFMGIAKDDPLRQQEGIYRSYIVGEGDKKIKIILLDVVYHRDRYRMFFNLFQPNFKGDVLGEAQWKWLENELTNSDAKVHLIASGLQVLPTGKVFTNWSSFPVARERLLKLLEKTQPDIPIVLSGDMHVGELSKIQLNNYSYPLYEVTSSGLTHHSRARKRGNKYRIGEQVAALNYGLLHISWGQDFTSITIDIRGEDNKLYLQEYFNYPAR